MAGKRLSHSFYKDPICISFYHEKRFIVPIPGMKNKVFPIKNLAFKFLAFSASQICNFANVISISLTVPSITNVLSMGS